MQQLRASASAADDGGKKKVYRPRRLMLLGDAGAAVVAAAVGHLVMSLRGEADSVGTIVTTALALLIGIITVTLLAWAGQYTKRQRISRLSDTGFLTRDLVGAVAIGVLISYVTKGFFTDVVGPSRVGLGTFVVLFWLLAIGVRFFIRAYQRHLFAHGSGVRKIMVLGDGPEADRMVDFIHSRPWLGVQVIGRLSYDEEAVYPLQKLDLSVDGDTPLGEYALPMQKFGASLEGLEHLDRAIRAAEVEDIVIALEPHEREQLPKITNLFSVARIPFSIVPSLFEETIVANRGAQMRNLRFLDTTVDPPARLVRAVKRTVDILVSICALLFLLPVGGLLVLAIVLDSGRPVLYGQERLGQYGKTFTIHKFRTMVKDAEARLAELKDRDEGDGPHFKMKRDPRLTRVGAFIRKWSLDELPQFWNVLRGEMSVVGPRPPLPREVAEYETSQLVRLKGKPGITGLWQVSGRKNLTFDDMVKLDRYYLENWSLRLDLSIMFRTISAVLTRRGAY